MTDWLREDKDLAPYSHPKQDELARKIRDEGLRGAGWRVAFVLETCGTYRELYVQEAAELNKLKGQVPKGQLEALRNALKDKYQRITPPGAEQALRAAVGGKYDKRGPTGTFNPGKTNPFVNKCAEGCKQVGRVFVVFMVYSEYQKISAAKDWQRQLGASGSGALGAITTYPRSAQ